MEPALVFMVLVSVVLGLVCIDTVNDITIGLLSIWLDGVVQDPTNRGAAGHDGVTSMVAPSVLSLSLVEVRLRYRYLLWHSPPPGLLPR